MTFLISYFYQVRNLSKNMVPISTALYDPKWFHDNKGPNNLYIDKRGIVNGARASFLSPDPNNNACTNCKNKKKNCIFKRKYEEQLSKLDFNEVKRTLEKSHPKNWF